MCRYVQQSSKNKFIEDQRYLNLITKAYFEPMLKLQAVTSVSFKLIFLLAVIYEGKFEKEMEDLVCHRFKE